MICFKDKDSLEKVSVDSTHIMTIFNVNLIDSVYAVTSIQERILIVKYSIVHLILLLF